MIVYSLPRGGFSNHKDKENLQDIRNYLEELAKLSYWDWVKVFDAIDTLGGIQKEIELISCNVRELVKTSDRIQRGLP